MNRSAWRWWCAAVLIASCGGGGGEDSSAVTGAPATPIGSPTSVTAIDADPCDLISADDVAAAAGHTVVDSDEQPPISCVFDLGAAGVDIFVAIEDGNGRLSGPAALFADYSTRVGDGSVEAVPNLGQAAVFDAGFRTIVVDAGAGRFFAIGVNGGFETLQEPRDTLIELAAAALGRL